MGKIWFLPALALIGCTGSIDGRGGGPGAAPGTSPPGGGPSPGGQPPAPPPRLPDEAPTTGAIASQPAPSSQFVRLNHRQWENTVRDLLGLAQPPGLSRQFVNEGIRTTFDTHGGDLEINAQLWQDFNKAANALATQVARDATLRAGLIPANAPADAEGRARAFITSFGLRAHRRPLTGAEVDQYLAVFRKGPELVGSGDAFVDGFELLLAHFLNSPYFLYRIELGNSVTGGKLQLTDHEIASRLSYGIANTMPDAELFAAAADKRLRTREALIEQTRRLLDSPAGQATMRDLHEQLSREVDPTELVRDPQLHPAYVPGIGKDLHEEALTFIHDVIYGQQKNVTELLTADYTFVNARLAPLYGVSAPGGASADQFTRVALDSRQRAGLYTQVGFLSTTGTDFNSRPIKRGVHISEHVLCTPAPPPPPEINTEPGERDPNRTNRQSFEAATEAPGTVCVGCHQGFINPLGFAFERYDGFGKYRESDNGKPVDSTGAFDFAEGRRTFQDAVGLMKQIATGSQAHECYAKHLLEYVHGRATTPADVGLIQELGRRSRLNVPIKTLVLDMVATDAFINRLP